MSQFVAEDMHEAANLSAKAIESIQLGSSEYVGRTLGVAETEIKEECPLTNSVRLMQPLMRFLQVKNLQIFLKSQSLYSFYAKITTETCKAICGNKTIKPTLIWFLKH